MATESFFDTYIIKKEEIPRFREIMTKKLEIDLPDCECKEVTGEELKELVERLLHK